MSEQNKTNWAKTLDGKKRYIREFRKEKGMSQTDLAIECDVCQASICNIENGREKAFEKRGQKIADAIGWDKDINILFAPIEEAEKMLAEMGA